MANWIRGNGDVQDGGTVNQSIPASTDVVWGNNSYTWGDVKLAAELVGLGGITPTRRKERLEKFLQKEPEKKTPR